MISKLSNGGTKNYGFFYNNSASTIYWQAAGANVLSNSQISSGSCSYIVGTYIPALPFCHSSFSSPRPKPPCYPNILNTLGDHLRKRRLDLGLHQKDAASQIGVDALTICNWEGNKSSPFILYIPKIIRFLGYNPFPAGEKLPEKLATARKVLGLSQKELAKTLGVDPTTVRAWEAGRHKPIRRCLEMIGSVFDNAQKSEM